MWRTQDGLYSPNVHLVFEAPSSRKGKVVAKTICIRVSDKTFERLDQLRGEYTWREFWMLCAIRHCQKVLNRGSGRRGIKAYKRDIEQFQQEIK